MIRVLVISDQENPVEQAGVDEILSMLKDFHDKKMFIGVEHLYAKR